MRTLRSVRESAAEAVLTPVAATLGSGLLTPESIAAAAQATLQRQVPAAFVDQVAELTGGVPWLVDLLLASTPDDGVSGPSSPGISRGLIDELGHVLLTEHGEIHELLLALAVGFDLSELPPAASLVQDVAIDDLIARANASGLVLPDGTLVPLVRRAMLETAPPYRLRSLRRRLVDAILAEGRPLDEDVAEALARTGLKDPRVAATLERAGDSVLATQPEIALTRYNDAVAAGSDELTTAARRAQAASAHGDLDLAARLLDHLLSQPDAPDLARAVDVAAAVWAQRGMLQRSADMYRWFGPERVGSSANLAAVAMIGVGDLEGADALRAAPAGGSPTLLSVAVGLMGQGLRDSLAGPAASALPALIRASDMMTAARVITPLPESPAVLAALVALHSGELSVADSTLDRAIAGKQGGPSAEPRLHLLRAWVAMQADKSERARTAIEQATADVRDLAPRDELLLRALEVGLARRADDAPRLVRAWQRARESLLHVPIDLYSLLPLGELVISATRLKDSAWLEAPLAEAWALLDRLENPPLWSVLLHWSLVQSAILADRPAALAPHAAALVRASATSRLAVVLAAAGRAWVAVRAGQFEVAAVEEAARGLASVGLTWDGSRLAGHAAARAEERKDMTRLLACARSLHPGSAATAQSAAGSPSRASGTAVGLSAREREVARLVLEGNTYEEIGEAIFISPRTVEHHVARIRRQLGASTRSEMLAQLRSVLGTDDGQ